MLAHLGGVVEVLFFLDRGGAGFGDGVDAIEPFDASDFIYRRLEGRVLSNFHVQRRWYVPCPNVAKYYCS